MRVLSISTLFPNPLKPSFGIFVGNQMRTIAARGDVDLVMVSPIGIPPFPFSLSETYRELARLPKHSDSVGLPTHYPRFSLIPKIGGDSNPVRIVRAILPLARRLHAEKPFDLVDAQFFFPDGPAAAVIANDLGLPLTIKSRGADIHFWGARPKARQQILAAASQATRLLTVSEALGRDMVVLGMPEERIRVHYTGLDRERFHPIDKRRARKSVAAHPSLLVPADGALIVTPGALIPRKGQRLVIEALGQLPGARLALAGGGGDEMALRDLASELGLSDRVHFLGIVTHDLLPQLLCAADVMALPSASEGLANAWVEALGCGTPIVITDIGGAREVVLDDTAGRIVARDPDAIASGIRDVLANPPGQSAVARHAERFSWDTNAERLVEIWREAIKR
ncbi:MAG: glycosyltransferase [Novosphingobium sp.]|nr:glycosyltransferase [Novosphingobium sp.]